MLPLLDRKTGDAETSGQAGAAAGSGDGRAGALGGAQGIGAFHGGKCIHATPSPQETSSLREAGLYGTVLIMDVPVLPMTAFHQAAGKRLREVIDLLGISYVDAGRIMGVSKHVLRNWMAGDHPVQPYALYRLCMVKGVDFNFVHLGDYTRLPPAMREALERDTISKLEAAAAAPPASANEPKALKTSP